MGTQFTYALACVHLVFYNKVAPGERLGLAVKKGSRDEMGSESNEQMVVAGFKRKNRKFEASGVRPGDVVTAVQSLSVAGLPYQTVMHAISTAIETGGSIELTFLSACSFSLKLSKTTVSANTLFPG
jgi:C-terminal processing protease CtpA/Prc